MKLYAKAVRFGLGVAMFSLISSHLGSRHAFAQTTYDLSLGAGQTISFVGGDKITITAYPDRSYCCSLQSALSTGGTPISFSSINGSSSLGSTLGSRGLNSPELSLSTTTSSNNKRVCWHEGDSTSSADALLTVSATATARALCEETSLLGGFNTISAGFNYLEITVTNSGANIFTDSVKGIIFITRTNGGTTVEIPFTIDIEPTESVKRADFSIHDAISNASDYGAVKIIHNGARDQVRAKVTQYRILSTSPLDFEPVLQETLIPVS